MSDIQFIRGTFHLFRATTKIHLGSLEKDILQDDLIEFDGQIVKLGLEEFSLPALKSGIKLGWLVPEGDTSVYIPQSSGVKVRPACSDSDEGGVEFRSQPVIVSDDQRVVSTLGSASLGQREGKLTDQDGQAVGKIKTSARQRTVITDASQVDREINRLASTPPPKVDMLPISGSELQDIVLDAAVTPIPKKGVIAIKTASSDKVVEIGGIRWDKGVQWRRRAKLAVDKYKDNPKILDAIRSIEAPSVQKLIDKMTR